MPSEPPGAPGAGDPSTTPTAAPTRSPAAAAKSKTIACKDPAGDQSSGGKSADMRSAVLAKDGDKLTVTITTAAAPPTTGTVLWTLDSFTADQSRVLQLGAKNVKGKQSAYYAFDFDSGQQNLPGKFTVDGARMVATFPWARVAALGRDADWGATLTLDNHEVDRCPNGATAAQVAAGPIKKKPNRYPAAWFR